MGVYKCKYVENVDTIKLAQKEETGWERRQCKLEQGNLSESVCSSGGQGLLLIWELPSLNFSGTSFSTYPSLLHRNYSYPSPHENVGFSG